MTLLKIEYNFQEMALFRLLIKNTIDGMLKVKAIMNTSAQKSCATNRI